MCGDSTSQADVQKLLEGQQIVDAMERALEESQFQVFYQPKHETVSGNIAGAEALVRWNHPEYGEELPKDFLSVLENYSLIHVLDTYVLERVIQILKVWKENGQDDKVISVNISTKDIYHMNIYDGLLFSYRHNLSSTEYHLNI